MELLHPETLACPSRRLEGVDLLGGWVVHHSMALVGLTPYARIRIHALVILAAAELLVWTRPSLLGRSSVMVHNGRTYVVGDSVPILRCPLRLRNLLLDLVLVVTLEVVLPDPCQILHEDSIVSGFEL